MLRIPIRSYEVQRQSSKFRCLSTACTTGCVVLITIGAKYMIVQDSKGILAVDSLSTRDHSAWSQVSVYDPSSRSALDAIWIDPIL